MAALTKDRNTPFRALDLQIDAPVAAAKKIFAGALVMLNASGDATPGAAATGQIPLGRARAQVDNSAGAAGDVTIEVESGVFRFANSAAADLIARAEIGDVCYIVDDQTVAKTDGTGSRSKAGLIVDVDAVTGEVWVDMRPAAVAAV